MRLWASFLMLLATIPASASADCKRPLAFAYSILSTSVAEPLAQNSFDIDLDRGVLWRGHAGERVSVCPNDSPYFCFTSVPLSFAVPRQSLHINQVWTVAGRTYTALGVQEFSLLGVRTTVFRISGAPVASDGAEPTIYFFSVERGLIALRLAAQIGEPPNIVVAEAGVGFAARSCAKSQSDAQP